MNRPRTNRTPNRSRGGKAARPVYVADFETTTDPKDCRVWEWGLTTIENPENDFEFGLTIDTFCQRMAEHDAVIYFHNLRFDGTFILDWLLRHGYEHVITDKSPAPGTFKTLISDMGKFYSFNITWRNGTKTELRDSAKKFPNFSVKRIAQSWKLGDTKGDIDYHAERPIGYMPTPAEIDYLKRDVVIVAKALAQAFANGMVKLTVASDSLAEFKKLTGHSVFTRLFPTLSEAMDAEIRRAYRGGFTYKDERWKGVTRSGIVLDVNSLYPSVMKDYALPFGEPEFIDGRVEPTPSRPLTIFSITFTAKLKTNHIPCIQIKGTNIFQPTEYLKEINDPTTMMMTNIDLALYREQYDIDILEYGGGWRFHAAHGLFDDFIDKWSRIKENSTGGIRELAKLQLNSLYGKFASNPNVTPKIPILEDGKVKLVRGPEDTRPPVYTAMGVFITSYARDITIRAAQHNFDVFAYADTDSLHLLTDEIPDNIEVHPTRMGAWKFEYAFSKAMFVRPKFYLEMVDRHRTVTLGVPEDKAPAHNSYHNAAAGIDTEVTEKFTFETVREGLVIPNAKKVPKTVPGGIVLEDSPFTIKL